jgi:N-ethylmaleimide reductase
MVSSIATTLLHQPVQLGELALRNRIVMAPLTRGRAYPNAVPSPRMATYYAQRADAGLIVTEATAISPQGYGWVNAPGMFNDEQVDGWKPVVEAIHDQGGLMVCQLWHMGRITHPDFFGLQPVAPSAITVNAHTHTPKGDQPLVTPHALTVDEIHAIVQDYAAAARRAKSAGFDGIEIHAANGYLLDEFLRSSANTRTDEYGGSVENRIRLVLQVLDAVCQVWPSGRVGLRVSPVSPKWDMADSNPVALYQGLANALNSYNLAYLHVMEARPGHMLAPKELTEPVTPAIRRIYKGNIIGCGGYTRRTALQAIENQSVDAVAFGVSFIANPDLVRRLADNTRLNMPRQELFYTDGDEGYLDYPVLASIANS